ncbi:MAG: hypothetical protein IT437_12970 [Phycisphaerales bacterium]|nr:hypothetical protein [Phycisphaerales bacterium]
MRIAQFVIPIVVCCPALLAQHAAPAPEPAGIALIQQQAVDLRPLVQSDLARAFLAAAAALPRIEPRSLLRDPATGEWFTDERAAALPGDRRGALVQVPITEERYYNTRYGTPLMYARALDILAEHGVAGIRGRRILDYGYGTVGHLRLLAACGADVVGVDVDPFLTALYSRPGDTGPVAAADPGLPGGSVKLVTGSWPGRVGPEVGGGYDVILSKNTLKKGYVHPSREADKRMLIDLGVADTEYLAALHDALKPGGLVLIYNLCPAPAPEDKPYLPHADGRCPFTREAIEGAGLSVLRFDAVDDDAGRAMFNAVGYPTTAADGSPDLFAWYTVLRRPG